MLIILSPAKSLDYTSQYSHPPASTPIFTKETQQLADHLKRLNVADLQNIMAISDNLAQLNYQRFQEFDNAPARPAILAFDGDVYEGIDKKNYRAEDFNFAQKHLLILSGLYGTLKPLDQIKPYRLEMGTDFKKIKFFIKNLYQFWGDKITMEINKHPASTIINLASQEYFKAVNPHMINKSIIEIVFQERRAGHYKIVGINAKKARGLMANFIIKNKITHPQNIQQFNLENYQFSPELSNNSKWVFVR